jgi:hypothetical protein
VETLKYNERLFSRGLRAKLHSGRFKFAARIVNKGPYKTVFELGCFDARSLAYLEKLPSAYVGADAGWEGGLTSARASWPQYEFHEARKASDLAFLRQRRFDVSICLETLEHIPPEDVDDYLSLLATITTDVLVVTVPIEFGPVFLAKHLAKRMSRKLSGEEDRSYSLSEIMFATLGMTSRVRRGEHKGFDYRWLRKKLEQFFIVRELQGTPFRLLGWLNFGMGFVCLPKRPFARP